MTWQVTVQVEGNLDDLMNGLMKKAVLATQLGAERLVQEHESLIQTWKADKKPQFEIGEAVREENAVYRIVYAHGLVWHYVNYGTTPTSIFLQRSPLGGRSFKRGGKMNFLFQGRGNSYSAKSDGGGGYQMGNPGWFSEINNRSIKPRDFIQKAIRQSGEAILARMGAAFAFGG